ncbi:MAG: GPW/gp25 family protein [Desulfobacteraceae bacterium]|nr:GPW/gp25 family protein [Desulfobacteraceae bacterium]
MERELLTDIGLELTHRELRPVYRVGDTRRLGPGGKGVMLDLAVKSGRDNLAQAIIMALLTPRGELSALGHPRYGSRLHELVGKVNTSTSHNLVRLHILETLQREPRIEKIVDAVVTPAKERQSSVDVTLQVVPVGETRTVTIGPITLELSP